MLDPKVFFLKLFLITKAVLFLFLYQKYSLIFITSPHKYIVSFILPIHREAAEYIPSEYEYESVSVSSFRLFSI